LPHNAGCFIVSTPIPPYHPFWKNESSEKRAITVESSSIWSAPTCLVINPRYTAAVSKRFSLFLHESQFARRTQETPYVMMHHEKNYTGNSRFYGFCMDLLAAVAREVGFSYRLELVPDRKYGARDPETGEWNGIVRELMRHV